MPQYTDLENKDTTVIEHTNMPSFVTFKSPFYSISPKASDSIGLYRVQGSLSDGAFSTPFSFNINVLQGQTNP
jgi:hypothetical protein